MATVIPKELSHIWIGPRKAPLDWMNTWVEKHPDWNYTLYDNEYLKSHEFRTRRQIDEYMKRGQYAGAADLMRYEILYEVGGYMPGADSICLRAIDEILDDGHSIYTVFENEFIRGSLVSPIVASVPGHPFVKMLIDVLAEVPPELLHEPWVQTGNLFVAEMIEKHAPDIMIWPSHFLIPEHYTGRKYTGDGPVYAHQLFGETTKGYARGSLIDRLRHRLKRRYARKAHKRRRQMIG